MSVNASQHELLQLIYRHLKEYGFHSAANELQRHSPQSECSVSASLLDIYSSWLSDPKKKRQPPSANCSSLNNKGRTPTKDSKTQAVASINQTKPEDDSSSDSEELSQSLLPQTPPTFSIKSPPTTPVKPVVTASPRKGKQAPAVSPVHAAASDSSATTDISVNEENAPAVAAKAVKQKKSPVTPKQARSRKDSPASIKKVGTSAKKRVQTPKKKDGSTLSTAASSAVKASPSVVTTGKKKDEPAAKAETPKKKSVPVKRKTPGGKDGENVSKAKKSKTQMKGVAAAAGGDDSDSDSSLDIEKWKKLVHLMTEDDIIKMATINALDSSTPQPKKKSVRKPRAAPPANKETQVSQNDETDKKIEMVEKKNTTDTPAKNSTPKRSRTKKPAPVTSPAVPHQEQNVSSVEDRPAASTLSPSKQTPAKQNSNTCALSEDKTDEAMSEPKEKKKKKKKKKEEGNKDTEEENSKGAGEDGLVKDRKEELKNKSEISEQVSDEKPVEEKKKAKGGQKQNENGAEIVVEKQILNVNDDGVAESVVPEQKKKAKKKKKEKSEGEENKVDSEQISEKENDSSEQIVSGKKDKKKKKTDVGNSEKTNKESEIMAEENKTADDNSVPTDEEKKKKKKRDKSEDNSEQISKEKKKRKKDRADHYEEMSELAVKDKKFTDVNSENRNESPLKSDSALLPPPDPETPGPTERYRDTEKKKRKSKFKLTDVPATPKTLSQDAAALEALSPPSSAVRKKKKKSSESKSPEDV